MYNESFNYRGISNALIGFRHWIENTTTEKPNGNLPPLQYLMIICLFAWYRDIFTPKGVFKMSLKWGNQ